MYHCAEDVATGVGVAVGVGPAYTKLLLSVVVDEETVLLTRKSNCVVPLGKLYRQGVLLLKSDQEPLLIRYDHTTEQYDVSGYEIVMQTGLSLTLCPSVGYEIEIGPMLLVQLGLLVGNTITCGDGDADGIVTGMGL